MQSPARSRAVWIAAVESVSPSGSAPKSRMLKMFDMILSSGFRMDSGLSPIIHENRRRVNRNPQIGEPGFFRASPFPKLHYPTPKRPKGLLYV